MAFLQVYIAIQKGQVQVLRDEYKTLYTEPAKSRLKPYTTTGSLASILLIALITTAFSLSKHVGHPLQAFIRGYVNDL